MSFQRNGKPSSLRRKEESFWITKPSWWRTCSLGSTAPLLGILWNLTHLTSRILSFIQYYTLKLVSVRMNDFVMCALCNEKMIVLIQNICVWVCGDMCMCCVCVPVCVCVSVCMLVFVGGSACVSVRRLRPGNNLGPLWHPSFSETRPFTSLELQRRLG